MKNDHISSSYILVGYPCRKIQMIVCAGSLGETLPYILVDYPHQG